MTREVPVLFGTVMGGWYVVLPYGFFCLSKKRKKIDLFTEQGTIAKILSDCSKNVERATYSLINQQSHRHI